MLAIPLDWWPSVMENKRTAVQELNHIKVLGRGQIFKGPERERETAGAGGCAV